MTSQTIGDDPTSREPAIDPAAIENLRSLQEDSGPDLLAELVDLFLVDAGPRLGRLREAVEHNDAIAVVREAHALKGACSNFGAQAMVRICNRLQGAGRTDDLIAAPELLARLEAEFERVCKALRAELSGVGREHLDRRG
jgi:HPt (histidine-containing phosphotransfer) domain-containing protein